MSEDLNAEIAERLHGLAEEFLGGKAYIATGIHEQHLEQLLSDEAGNDRWQVNGLHSVTFTYATTPEVAEAYRTDPAREPDLKHLLRRVMKETPRHEESWQCESCGCDEHAPHRRDCIIAEAARIAMELTRDLCSEMEPHDWPEWDDAP